MLVDADGLGGSGVSGPDGAFELSVPEGWSGTLTGFPDELVFLPPRFPWDLWRRSCRRDISREYVSGSPCVAAAAHRR